MALTTTVTVGRLLARGELITTAKLNAMVRGIVINIDGSVGSGDLAAGAVTAAAVSPDAYWYAPATFDGSATYTAAYAPAIGSYMDGLVLAFKANAANLGISNFVAGAGPLPIVKYGGSETLDAGDIAANGIVCVRYNTTILGSGPVWELLSLPGRPPIVTAFVPATEYLNGEIGFVPQPMAGQQNNYLRADGTWVDPVAEAVAEVVAQNTYTEIYKQQQFI